MYFSSYMVTIYIINSDFCRVKLCSARCKNGLNFLTTSNKSLKQKEEKELSRKLLCSRTYKAPVITKRLVDRNEI